MNEEEAESLNRPVTADRIEAVIKKVPAHKSPGLNDFTGEFYKAFNGKLNPLLHRVFQKFQKHRRLLNSSYEASIILIPLPDNDTTKKDNCRPISLMNIATKILNKILANHIQQYIKRSYTMIKWCSSQGCKDSTICAYQ